MLQCSKPILFILGSFFSNREIDAMQQHLVNKATGQVCCPAAKRLGKKLSNLNQNGIDYCKLKTCTVYISFTAIWGLTAIDKISLAG